jgi:hypothetical protein
MAAEIAEIAEIAEERREGIGGSPWAAVFVV